MAAKTRQDLLDVLGRTMDPNWVEPILVDPDSAAPVNAAADALVLLSGEAQVACDNVNISTAAAGRGGTSTITLSRTASGTHGTIPQGYTFTDSRGLVASSLGPTTVNNGDLTVQVAVQTQRKTELVNTVNDPGYSIAPNLAVADSGGTNALVGQSPAPSGYPTIVSTTFTVVSSSTPIVDGASDWLAVIGRERGQLRQASEADEAYRLRVRNVPDAVSPAAIQQEAVGAASHGVIPPPTFAEPLNDGTDQSARDAFGIDWFDCLYMSGQLLPTGNVDASNTPGTDFAEDIQPANGRVRETVSLREASCYFRETVPGPIPDPGSGVTFLDDGFWDDYILGFPDTSAASAVTAALMAVWEGCNRKRAAGVRFDEYVADTVRLTARGTTNSAAPTVVFTMTPPVGKVWLLRDGHFGWDSQPNPPPRPSFDTGSSDHVFGWLTFTFADSSTYTTPTLEDPWGQRVAGPLGGVTSRITQVQGVLHTAGVRTAGLVGNIVVLEVVA